jgi:hypothetical protein
MPDLVDIEKPDTWPASVLEWAERWATQLRDSTEYFSDLAIPPEDEDEFRSLLREHPLCAFHATRLLDHEVEMIRKQGLRPLTTHLLEDRTNAAFDHSVFTADERDQLLNSTVFALGEAKYRKGQVNLFLGTHVLRDSVQQIAPLLRTWGGEGIYWGAGDLRSRLREVGTPTIVVAGIDLSPGWRIHRTTPGLHKVFIGCLLNLADVSASVDYTQPVPPQHVPGIWQPGIPEYDSFELLPR